VPHHIPKCFWVNVIPVEHRIGELLFQCLQLSGGDPDSRDHLCLFIRFESNLEARPSSVRLLPRRS